MLCFLLTGINAEAAPLGKRIVLENGIVLLLSERHTIPSVTINMLIKAGQVAEPSDKAGLAQIAAGLLTEGTKKRSSSQIAEEIEFVGGGIGASGGDDSASVNLTVLKKDLDLGLDILSDILINPIFPEEEIKRKVKETKAAIEKEKDDPSAIAGKEFARLLFGEHPYGRPTEGTPESLDKITREDIVKFHATYYAPNNAIMAVVGDVTEEEIVSRLNKYLSGWIPRELPNRILPIVKPPKHKIVKPMDKKITQANIILGHIGLERENPDYYAVYVMNYILGGGGFTSRLMDNIRDTKGLAYDVHSYFSPMKYSGSFNIGVQTKNESAKTAIEEALKEMERIRKETVSDKELEDAKAYLTGSFPLRLDTNSKISGMLTAFEFYSLGLDYPDRYPKIINALTKNDILKAARKYLNLDSYILVVVGDIEKAGIKGLPAMP
ncbi:MAG TPA: pitrilysin family protein [Thermodesulfobacteriota bacterium]|nr:pitrilysin family protein [Thermodesulfobacteriota bacterium]